MDKINKLETEVEKWKSAFKKYAAHNVSCMISNEHHNTPCKCGYSKLRKELLEDNEDWTNWAPGKQPY